MDELAGLGDQATSVGPMILIRRGEDLITLVISGVPDGTTAAKSTLLKKKLEAPLTGTQMDLFRKRVQTVPCFDMSL